MNLDNLVEEEISHLSARISTADSVLAEFANIVKSITLIRHNLQLSKDIMDAGNPALAYKTLLESLAIFIDVNKNLVDSVLTLQKDLIQRNEPQS